MPSLPMYFPVGFSLDRALLCARLVIQAYGQYQQWVAQGKPDHRKDFRWTPTATRGWQFAGPVWSVLSELHFLNESEPFGFAARDDTGQAYLVLRGTESAQDWLDDLEANQEPWPWQDGRGRVHAGFLKLYRSLRVAALEALESLKPAGPLWVCGHSLGSALSSMSVPDLRERWPAQPLQHYNFASPRLAAPDFADSYNALGVPTFRVVNDSDLVPEVPPGVTGDLVYQHVGLAVTFTASHDGVADDHSMQNCYLYALEHPQAPMHH